jgi:hypothetical protein
MRPSHLKVWPTLSASYREWWRTVGALRPLILNTFLIMLALLAAAEFIPPRWEAGPLGEATTIMQEAVRALLLTPIGFAIHRFVILDKSERSYAFPLGDRNFWRYFRWLFGLQVLTGLPLDFLGLLETLNVSLVATTLAFVAALVVALWLLTRLSLLLPAIAVGSSEAEPKRALADTRGQSIRILAIMIFAILPFIAASIAGVILLGKGVAVTGSPPAIAGLILGGAVQTIMFSLTSVVLSLMFIALAHRA